MSKQKAAPLGASLIVLSSFFYASYGIWTKLMGNFFDGYTASVFRSILVVLILLPPALIYRQLKPLLWKRNGFYIAGMFAASIFTWGPLYYAILHAGVGISLAIAYASIVLGMFFLGWVFGDEHFNRDKLLSAGLGIIGLALLFSPTHHLAWLALLAALVSGLSSATNNVLAKHIRYNATQTTLVVWILSILANGLMAVALRRPFPSISLHIEWFYLVIFAIASVIASWSFVKGVKLIDAGAAGILGLLEVVFGVFFGVLFFHERPGVVASIGMVMIVIAAAIPYLRDYNARLGTLEADKK